VYCFQWKKLIKTVDDINSTDKFVSYSMNESAFKVHTGYKHILTEIKPELKRFTFQLQEDGIQLTSRMVGKEVSHLLQGSSEKTTPAKELVARHFTKPIIPTHRATTHTV
jgi:hypothetical protein